MSLIRRSLLLAKLNFGFRYLRFKAFFSRVISSVSKAKSVNVPALPFVVLLSHSTAYLSTSVSDIQIIDAGVHLEQINTTLAVNTYNAEVSALITEYRIDAVLCTDLVDAQVMPLTYNIENVFNYDINIIEADAYALTSIEIPYEVALTTVQIVFSAPDYAYAEYMQMSNISKIIFNMGKASTFIGDYSKMYMLLDVVSVAANTNALDSVFSKAVLSLSTSFTLSRNAVVGDYYSTRLYNMDNKSLKELSVR